MSIKQLNALNKETLSFEFKKCCGSSQWIRSMIAARPYANKELMHEFSDKVWQKCSEEDFLEAFKHHPQIGDVDSLKKKFAHTAKWATNEQIGTSTASKTILNNLKSSNDEYLNKFGFIFIVCATGKSAQEMLDLLNQRLPNTRADELLIAAEEQNKITHLRLNKLIQLGATNYAATKKQNTM